MPGSIVNIAPNMQFGVVASNKTCSETPLSICDRGVLLATCGSVVPHCVPLRPLLSLLWAFRACVTALV
eukprot:6195848-Pleurochrysis_carterae.AAC.2